MEWSRVEPSGAEWKRWRGRWRDMTRRFTARRQHRTKHQKSSRNSRNAERWSSLRINKHTRRLWLLLSRPSGMFHRPPPPPPPASSSGHLLLRSPSLFFASSSIPRWLPRNNAGPPYDLFVPFFQVVFNPATSSSSSSSSSADLLLRWPPPPEGVSETSIEINFTWPRSMAASIFNLWEEEKMASDGSSARTTLFDLWPLHYLPRA